jgi:hypothetical protein
VVLLVVLASIRPELFASKLEIGILIEAAADSIFRDRALGHGPWFW